jgi:hypothetical protein
MPSAVPTPQAKFWFWFVLFAYFCAVSAVVVFQRAGVRRHLETLHVVRRAEPKSPGRDRNHRRRAAEHREYVGRARFLFTGALCQDGRP